MDPGNNGPWEFGMMSRAGIAEKRN